MNRKLMFLRVLMIIGIAAVAVFAAMLVRELYIDRQSRSYYSDMLSEIETSPRKPPVTDAGDATLPDQPVQPDRPDQHDTLDEGWTPYVDFDLLGAKYPGIVAWIKLEGDPADNQGNPIDYPVMQYTDNDHFLSLLPDGTYHRSGSIFLDYRNNSDFSDKSILIYGHESRTQEMFAALKNYRDQDYYDANPVIYLHTPQQDYMIVLFAGHLAHSQRDHPPLFFKDDEEFLDYIEGIRSISFFNSDVVVSADDRIVSLCTCAYDFDEARLVLAGILIGY